MRPTSPEDRHRAVAPEACFAVQAALLDLADQVGIEEARAIYEAALIVAPADRAAAHEALVSALLAARIM